ncbi:MAG: proteasome-type protease [Rhodospirillales bacterium]|nr:proteasome-type protease [Rhodospirillales bacterium]
MSYCLGIKVAEGLVFASDSRTNAGVDSVSTFRKLFVFDEPGERVIVVLTAGNLAVTQEVVNMVDRGLAFDDAERNILLVESMFDAARVIGNCLRTVFDRDADYFKAHSSEFVASLIVGGQIKGERPRLFMLYPIGNFIEACEETPYFQLGETKYGKPILERVLAPELGVMETAKCALVSFDSTIQANISVGPPIDLLIYRSDTFRVETRQRIEENDPYFLGLRQHWSEGLRRVFTGAPDPQWGSADS